MAVQNGFQLLTSSSPFLDEVAAAAGAAVLFLVRRQDPGRFAHIGGVGRGVGWAGSVGVGGYGAFDVRGGETGGGRAPAAVAPGQVPARPVPGCSPSKELRARVAGVDMPQRSEA